MTSLTESGEYSDTLTETGSSVFSSLDEFGFSVFGTSTPVATQLNAMFWCNF